jgi:hypothetical protein
MAYDFATNKYLQATQTNTQPLTLAGWGYYRANGSHTTVAAVVPSASNWMSVHGSANSGNVASRAYIQPSDRQALSTTTESQNVWVHVAATFTGTSPMTLTTFLNGGGKASATQNYNPTLTALSIGALRVINGTFEVSNALIAECGVWSVVLTDDEIVSLAKGFSPRKVRPQSLRAYFPMRRDLNELRSGLAVTNGNTATVANHPRVYA